MSSIVMFGIDKRLRMEDGGEEGVGVVQERMGADGSWSEVVSMIVPREKVGDVCAALARMYDLTLTRKMAGSKKP
jgi:hypothetical protein